MKNVAKVLVLAISTLVVMAGCKGDPIKDDLASYTSGTYSITQKYSGDMTKKMEEINKESNPVAVIDKMNKNILPILKEQREKLEAVKPATKEVQDIHNAYMTALKNAEEGIKGMGDALKAKNEGLMKSSAEKLDAAGPAEEKWKKDLVELGQKHNFKIETK